MLGYFHYWQDIAFCAIISLFILINVCVKAFYLELSALIEGNQTDQHIWQKKSLFLEIALYPRVKFKQYDNSLASLWNCKWRLVKLVWLCRYSHINDIENMAFCWKIPSPFLTGLTYRMWSPSPPYILAYCREHPKRLSLSLMTRRCWFRKRLPVSPDLLNQKSCWNQWLTYKKNLIPEHVFDCHESHPIIYEVMCLFYLENAYATSPKVVHKL